jgi:heat-inducible transcriptional repressor
LIERPPGLVASALTEASNYLNGQLKGRSLGELRRDTQRQMATVESELGKLTAQLVETGLAQWGGDSPSPMSQSNEILGKNLLVRGHSHLLENLSAIEDLERIRLLFEDLDRKKEMVSLLSQAEEGDGVKIFIGAETSLFSLSGSSVIISPYKDSDQQVVGVLGVIAPTRTNYARLIPMVDHTAQVVSKLLA